MLSSVPTLAARVRCCAASSSRFGADASNVSSNACSSRHIRVTYFTDIAFTNPVKVKVAKINNNVAISMATDALGMENEHDLS